MKTPALCLLALLLCSACVKAPSLKSELLDSAAYRPRPAAFSLPELRLGAVRYRKDRASEREVIAWHLLPAQGFRQGVPAQDQEEYDSVKVKIYEVGEVESGRFRGHFLERWDVLEEFVPAAGTPRVERYHHYFLRSGEALTHLPAMARGSAAAPAWLKRKDVGNYLRGRWRLALKSDARFQVPELKASRRIEVPGEGVFQLSPSGESIQATEARLGSSIALASLPQGKEVVRVPGDWIVCVYPDGLAVHLRKD